MNDRQQKIAEALECTRAGDLDRLDEFPELRELAESVDTDAGVASRLAATHRSDAVISSALLGAECPPGLAERISAQIAAAESQPTEASEPQPEFVKAAPASKREQGRGSRAARNRSQWIAISSVAAVLLLAVFPIVWPSPARTKPQLVARTPVWKKAADKADWRTSEPPQDRPWSRQLGWSPYAVAVFPTVDDGRTTAYRYPTNERRPREQILVFVLDASASGLPSSPPATPDFDSGGIRVGVWSENGLVYALVVLGNDEAYDELVQSRAREV